MSNITSCKIYGKISCKIYFIGQREFQQFLADKEFL